MNDYLSEANILCYKANKLCYRTSKLCYGTSKLCYGTSKLCYRASKLCYGTSKLCYTASKLCYGTSKLCYGSNTENQYAKSIFSSFLSFPFSLLLIYGCSELHPSRRRQLLVSGCRVSSQI